MFHMKHLASRSGFGGLKKCADASVQKYVLKIFQILLMQGRDIRKGICFSKFLVFAFAELVEWQQLDLGSPCLF